MIVWLVFMFFYSFGRRAPTKGMMTFAGAAGVLETCTLDVLLLLHLIGG